MKSIWACGSIFLLLLSRPVSGGVGKNGERLSVTLKDGRVIEGELLSVIADSLVLMDSSSTAGIGIRIGDAAQLKVLKKSKALNGLGSGFLFGGAVGGGIGFLSGDDEPGWFSMTAGQKAMALGLGLGLVGAAIGGLGGAAMGMDESSDLTFMPKDAVNAVLDKLKSRARFEGPIPPDLPVHQAAPTAVDLKEPSNETPPLPVEPIPGGEASAKPEKFSRFHFHFVPGLFFSHGPGQSLDLLTISGFNHSVFYSDDWFGSSGGTTEFPRKTKNPHFFVKDVGIDYSFNRHFAAGFDMSPLGDNGTEGCRVIPNNDYRPGLNSSDLYLVNDYDGRTYFLTASWFPVPDAFLRKSTVKMTAGLGLARVRMDFYGSEYSYAYEQTGNDLPSGGRRLIRNAPAVLFSAEGMHFFNAQWSLGIQVDYKIVPVQTDRFTVGCGYAYYEASGRRQEASFPVEMPGRNWNLGGIGFGIDFGLHL
jgi:hypothetical protein